ncbi:MAG: Dna[CI] antecedent, DciA [Bacteroidota bacterium]|jgi:predicted nucleic acid-binding Zn ribbon protein
MIQLSDLLKTFIRSRHLDDELDKARIPKYWEEVVGKGLASRTEIRSFEHGVLRVHVPEASWRHELTMRRDELRRSINHTAGKDLIREIVIR